MKLVRFENNTVDSNLLGNSAQHVFTVGDELYVILPQERYFCYILRWFNN